MTEETITDDGYKPRPCACTDDGPCSFHAGIVFGNRNESAAERAAREGAR